MKRRIELLAPGGDMESIKAAIGAGAAAVYCGLNKFNARNRAENISIDDLNGILRLAHSYNCKVFLTMNILVVEQEIPDLIRLLNRLINTSIDGIIIQDLGLFYLLSTYFPGLMIHASTQLTTHNEGQMKFLRELRATRVNLSRELSLEEIRSMSRVAHANGLLCEVFVHGSYCISFSGLCYMSSLHGGNSGNRGRCSQPCRDQYLRTPSGSQFPLNMKDNSAWSDLKDLAEAGVDSIKIEGRIKKFHYVYTVVDSFRKQLQRLYEGKNLSLDNSQLFRVFNRNFSNGYLKGEITRDMYSENPRDHSATHLAALSGDTSGKAIENAEKLIYEEKTEIRTQVKSITDRLIADRAPLTMTVYGEEGSPLTVDIKTPTSSATFTSVKNLERNERISLDHKEIEKRFKAINDTEYTIEHISVENLQAGLFLPFSELSSLKKQILYFLMDSKEYITPLKLPALARPAVPATSPVLFVLISSKEDLLLYRDTDARIFYQLPDSLYEKRAEYIELFKRNTKITLWFPSILIGKDFSDAVELLKELEPRQIVTDNSGVAYEACRLGIPWIAGPRLNLTNSYSLITLKERFNCFGAFISNELNKRQIRAIKRPEDFELYYSIYHPIEVMISRQCFFLQVSGCEKNMTDEYCIRTCSKTTSITNLKNTTFFIDKRAGSYNRIYNESAFMNTDIVEDLPDLFSGFLVDLREIKTNTRIREEKVKIIELLENHIKGQAGSAERLKNAIAPTNQRQYLQGI